jgi:hypothetical protein
VNTATLKTLQGTKGSAIAVVEGEMKMMKITLRSLEEENLAFKFSGKCANNPCISQVSFQTIYSNEPN